MANSGGPRTGVIFVGGHSFSVTQAFENAPPAVSGNTLTGSSVAGSRQPQYFDFTFTDPNGGVDIRLVNVLFQTTPTTSGACYVEYNQAANSFRLADDSGANWSVPHLAATGKVFPANSQCTLWPHVSFARVIGNNLTLHVGLVFSATFAGTRNVYLAVEDVAGSKTGW